MIAPAVMRSTARVLAYAWAAPGTALGLILALTTRTRGVVRTGALDVSSDRGYCALHRRFGFAAITLGHVVLRVASPSAPPSPPDQRLWAHELAHIRQWEAFGPLMFLLYPLCSLAGWRRNPFERSAIARAAQTAHMH